MSSPGAASSPQCGTAVATVPPPLRPTTAAVAGGGSRPVMGAAARAKAKAKAKARGKHATHKATRHRQEAHEAQERRAHEEEEEQEEESSEEDDNAIRSFPDCLEGDYLEWSDDQRAEVMAAIVSELRRHCAREGTSPGDETSLFMPTAATASGVRHGTDDGCWFAGTNAITAFFLDSFLYSHEEMQRMIDDGALDIFWCQRCQRTVPGDCRRKPDSERAAEESARRILIDSMRRQHRDAAKERKRRRTIAPVASDASASTSAVSLVTAAPAIAAAPPSVQPSFFESALSTLANSFSFLSTADDDEIAVSDSEDDAPPDDAAEATAAGAALVAAIAALPPISPWAYPRNNASPKQCRYCHATSSQVAVRTHMTHSLSVAQMADMYRLLVVPNVDFSQPIGHVRSKRVKTHPTTTSTIDPSVYALDIGSRLGNQLLMGLLHTRCPRWVGVELDSFFVTQSRRVVRKWRMQSHIRVVEGDIALHADLLRGAKLVFFFNAFELHVTREKHRELLQFLTDTISQPNQYLVSCPALTDIYQRAGSEIDLGAWVELVAEKDDAFLYRVR